MNFYLFLTVLIATGCIMKTTSWMQHKFLIQENLEVANTYLLEDNKKYIVSLSQITVGVGIAIFSATFQPSPSEAVKCTYNLTTNELSERQNTSTGCDLIRIDQLKSDTTYQINFHYDNEFTTHSFRTLTNHSLEIYQNKLTCERVTFEIIYTPPISQLGIPKCNGSLADSTGMKFLCDSQKCTMTCSQISFSSLKENTKYTYYIGANPHYTDINVSTSFKTLSHSTYKLSVADARTHSVVINIENSVSESHSCRIKFKNKKEKKYTTRFLNSCEKYNIEKLSPGTSYIIEVEPDDKIFCDSNIIDVKTKYVVVLEVSDITIFSALITASFIPDLVQPTSCTYSLYDGFSYFKKNEPTSCEKINPTSLTKNQKYQFYLFYEEYNYTTSFTTLSTYEIDSTVTELTCDNVTLTNKFNPDFSEPSTNPCKGLLANSDGTPFPCTALICETKCLGAKFKNLKENTEYIYYFGAYPYYTDTNGSKSFRTLSHSPYELYFKSVSSITASIGVKHESSIKRDCFVIIINIKTNEEVYNQGFKGCSEKRSAQLFPGEKYKMFVEEDILIFCDTKELYFSMKYDVMITAIDITTVSAVIIATFKPARTTEEICKYNLSTNSKLVVKDKVTSCERIELDSLTENHNYEFSIKYREYSYLTNFQTLPNHKITTVQSSLTCTSVKFTNEFTPDIPKPMIPLCNGSLANSDGTPFSCTPLRCQMSCTEATFSLLNENTKYTYYIGAYPFYNDFNKSKSFTTLLHSPYTIDLIQTTETSIAIHIKGRPLAIQGCHITFTDVGTQNIGYEENLSDCSGKKNITGLTKGRIYNIKLKADQLIYCDYLNIDVSTKFSVTIDYTPTTVSADFKIQFDPVLPEPHSKCSLTYHSESDEKKTKLFDCKTVKISDLLSDTSYEINVTFERSSYFKNISTNLNYSITPKVVDKTCKSVKVCNTFSPSISYLDMISCENYLKSKSHFYQCDGNDCVSSCECILYLNLQPGASYIYYVSSYPNLTSKNFTSKFDIEPPTPFIVSKDYSNYSTIKVEFSSSTTVDIPKCSYTVESKTLSYSKVYMLDKCDTQEFTGLLPMQRYIITMLPNPNIYCDINKIEIETAQFLRTVSLLETKANHLLISFTSVYKDENIQDICYINVSNVSNSEEKVYISTPCDEIKVKDLLSGTPYAISLKNKFSNSSHNYTFVTEIEKCISNFEMSLNGSQLKISWINNITTSTTLIYSINLYSIDDDSSIRLSEKEVYKIFCKPNETETTFKNLIVKKKYKISHCARPLNYSCSTLSQDNTNCYSCYREDFFTPIPLKYNQCVIFYNNTENYINITYLPPSEEEFGMIKYCFISFGILKNEFSGNIDFQDPSKELVVKGNKWKTIKHLKASECSGSRFTVISLNDSMSSTSFKELFGYYVSFAVTYCSNVLCLSTVPSVKTYIPKYSFLITIIIFCVSLFLSLIFSALLVIVIISKFQEYNIAIANKKHESQEYTLQVVAGNILDTGKKESNCKEASISGSRDIDRIYPDLPDEIEELRTDKSLVKRNKDNVMLLRDVETDLINISEITSSFEQVLEKGDDRFLKQFEIIEKRKPMSMKEGVSSSNINLNRYKNVIPGDHFLLPISGKYTDHKYVNASKIFGLFSDFDYIATQGPKLNTIVDFIGMIVEFKVTKVVMLTNLNENGTQKCDQYLPEVGEICSFGRFKLTRTDASNSIKSQIPEGIIISDIEVEDTEYKTFHMFRHYHFTIWPDKTVPKDLESLIQFRELVREEDGSSRAPILVHCSAGVGRTGTFITFDYNLCRLEKNIKTFSVSGYVLQMRKSRPLMVQTYEQYLFVLKLLARVILSRRSKDD